MIKVKPLVKFEILLQAHGLHSTGQQAGHCLDLVHNNLYLVHAKVQKIAKIEDDLKVTRADISFLIDYIVYQDSPRLTSENKRLISENKALSRVVSKLSLQ